MSDLEQYLKQKRHKNLLFIAILSLLNIAYEILGQIQAFIVGKLSESKMEQIISQSKEVVNETGVEDVYGIFDKMHAVQYIQNDKFFLSHGLALITLIIGAIGVLYMLKSKSTGFQLYIVYCILSVFGMFLYVPFDKIPFPLVITNAFFSGIFVLMYHLNRSWNREKIEEKEL